MDPGDLVLLDAIVTEGSITGASRKLGEPMATISRRLQRLEKAAGAPLFDRTSRRLRPTPLAESLAAPAAAIRVALAGAVSAADAMRRGDSGRLRVAAPFLFGRLVVAPCVGRLTALHAEMDVTLRFTNEPVNPLRDGFDLAIQIMEPLAPYIVSSKLASAELKLYAAPQVAQTITVMDDLRRHKTVSTSNDASEHMILRLTDDERVWEERLRVACTVNDPEAACYVAARGTAVAALPTFLAQCFVRTGDLSPVLPSLKAGSVKIFAATPPGRLAVPLVRTFLTELKKEIADQQFAK